MLQPKIKIEMIRPMLNIRLQFISNESLFDFHMVNHLRSLMRLRVDDWW